VFLNAGLVDEFFIHIAPVFVRIVASGCLMALIKTNMTFKLPSNTFGFDNTFKVQIDEEIITTIVTQW
jgi:hypothetical protein